MNIVTLIIAFTVLTAVGWALALWVQADSFHPRAPRREWFD
jgi:hypothetical protein